MTYNQHKLSVLTITHPPNSDAVWLMQGGSEQNTTITGEHALATRRTASS